MTPKRKDGSVETEQAAPTAEKKGPLKVFVIEDVSASVFGREYPVKGELRMFYSVSFSRSYRDSYGTRKYVKTFNLEDLGKIVSLAQQADEYIRSLLNPQIEQ